MLQQPPPTHRPATMRPPTTATAPTQARSRPEPTPDEVRRHAYQLYERRNREPGHEVEDWLQAEQELRQRQQA